MQKLGLQAICIDARKMAAILSVTVNKTDKNDAKGIADAMRCNHYKEVGLRDDHANSVGILLKSRTTLVQTRTALKNTVRGYFKSYGLRLGQVSHQKIPKIVREHYEDLLPETRKGVESLLKSYETISKEIAILDNELKEICKQDKEVPR